MKRQIIDMHQDCRPACPMTFVFGEDEELMCSGGTCAVWSPLTYAEFEAEKWPGDEEKKFEAGRYGRCGL